MQPGVTAAWILCEGDHVTSTATANRHHHCHHHYHHYRPLPIYCVILPHSLYIIFISLSLILKSKACYNSSLSHFPLFDISFCSLSTSFDGRIFFLYAWVCVSFV